MTLKIAFLNLGFREERSIKICVFDESKDSSKEN